MKYCIVYSLIVLIPLSCNYDNKNNQKVCNENNIKLNINNSGFFMKIPVQLNSIRDTTNYSFEYNPLLRYVEIFYSKDSLSSIYIQVTDFNSLQPAPIEKSINELGDYYKMLYRNNNPKDYTLFYGTKNKSYFGNFKFIINEEKNNSAIGGILAYHKNHQYHLFFELDGRNFQSPMEDLDCMLESIQFNK